MDIPFDGDHFQGINRFLFTRLNYTLDREIYATGEKYGTYSDPINVFDPNKNETNWVSASDTKFIPLTVEYFHYFLHITNYTIQTRTQLKVDLPKGWDLHGSYDGVSWELLHSINNSDDLTEAGAYHTYECFNRGSYRFFRFNMTQKNTNNKTHFHVNKIEFFGTIAPLYNPFAKPSCKYSTYSHMYISIIFIVLS